ncbi:MAG: hypothetical protein ACRDQH_09605, partial [Pseudonocardiaceae bacterium]
VTTDLEATFTPAGAARRRAYNAAFPTDSLLAAPKLVPLIGPDDMAAESFSQTTVDRILTLT